MGAQPWLPDTALFDRALHARLAEGLARWCAAWLVQGPMPEPTPEPTLEAGDWQPCVGPAPSDGVRLAAGLTLQCHPDDRLRLAAMLLATPLTDRSLRTAADRQLVLGVVDDALAALGQELVRALALPPASAADQQGKTYRLAIGSVEDGPLMHLVASGSLLAALRRAAASPARPQPRPLPPRQALGPQPVSLSGHLGSSRLRLAEVEALAVGDVIVLDHPADAPVTLLVDGQVLASAAAFVQSGPAHHVLVIEKAANQW